MNNVHHAPLISGGIIGRLYRQRTWETGVLRQGTGVSGRDRKQAVNEGNYL